MKEFNTKIVNLAYLNEMTEGESDLLKEMIDIFFTQVDEFIELMHKHYNEQDYESLGKLAHKAKSSISIMGMADLAEDLKNLEILTKNNEQIDQYPNYITKFENQCKLAVDELKEIYKEL